MSLDKIIFPLVIALISAVIGTVLEFIAEIKVLNHRAVNVRTFLQKEEGLEILLDTIRGKSLVLGFMSFAVWAVSWPIENNLLGRKALALSLVLLLSTVGLL
ncbi:MAG: hypothetical protein M0033_10885 [Nitrospiraceae bacterium]|nr:hypothetical protein [Nitrospiraceae bacterium]